MESPQVQHAESRRRFEAGQAHLIYRRDGDRLVIEHTYIPAQLRGRGLAAALAHAVLSEARTRGWKVVPHCSYVAGYIARHPEFEDLLATSKQARADHECHS